MIAFDAVEVVEEISAEDARAAGFETPEQVEAAMPPRGPIHRVALRLEGPDPRVALRETPPDDALFARLDRMGPWTYEYLQLIAERPAVRAGDLAESVGRERLDFKRDVRKLKELGLTESPSNRSGYRLSPRARLSCTLSSRAERALEHVALTLGRPAGDRTSSDACRRSSTRPLSDVDVARADGLVAGAFELLGDPDRRGDPVQELARRPRARATRTRRGPGCPCGGSGRPGRSAPTSRGVKPGRPALRIR